MFLCQAPRLCQIDRLPCEDFGVLPGVDYPATLTPAVGL